MMDHPTRLETARDNARDLTMSRPALACFGEDQYGQYCRVVPAPFRASQQYQSYIALLPPVAQWFAYTTVSPPLFSLVTTVDAECATAEQLLAHLSRWQDHYAELWNQVETEVRRLHSWGDDFNVHFCKRATLASQLVLDIVSGGDYAQWGFVSFAEGVFALGMMRRLVGKRTDVIYFFGNVEQHIAESLAGLAKKYGTKNIIFQVPVLTELGRLIEPSLVRTVKEVMENSVNEGVIDRYVIVMDGPQASNRLMSAFSDSAYPVDFWISTTGKAGLSPWNTSVLAFRPDHILAKGLFHAVPTWLPSITELAAMRAALSMWTTDDATRLRYWSALSEELFVALEKRLGDRIDVEGKAASHPGIVLISVAGQDSKTLTSRLRNRLVSEFRIPLGTPGVRRDQEDVAKHFLRIGLPPHTLDAPPPSFDVLTNAIEMALSN